MSEERALPNKPTEVPEAPNLDRVGSRRFGRAGHHMKPSLRDGTPGEVGRADLELGVFP